MTNYTQHIEYSYQKHSTSDVDSVSLSAAYETLNHSQLLSKVKPERNDSRWSNKNFKTCTWKLTFSSPTGQSTQQLEKTEEWCILRRRIFAFASQYFHKWPSTPTKQEVLHSCGVTKQPLFQRITKKNAKKEVLHCQYLKTTTKNTNSLQTPLKRKVV